MIYSVDRKGLSTGLYSTCKSHKSDGGYFIFFKRNDSAVIRYPCHFIVDYTTTERIAIVGRISDIKEVGICSCKISRSRCAFTNCGSGSTFPAINRVEPQGCFKRDIGIRGIYLQKENIQRTLTLQFKCDMLRAGSCFEIGNGIDVVYYSVDDKGFGA
ncbi:hypothetical protein SDC9_127848 [bioreactor metagenome]|uniref:Uncharacterized protein n=1 Tax=bioreactor metagenome TaxID=1076179 RepID=A0A645CVB7_9ZZZZ